MKRVLPLKALRFDPKVPSHVDLGHQTEFTNLGRVNLFVGANNSGKSRLLRLLASQEWHHAYDLSPEFAPRFSQLYERARKIEVDASGDWRALIDRLETLSRGDLFWSDLIEVDQFFEATQDQNKVDGLRNREKIRIKGTFEIPKLVELSDQGRRLCGEVKQDYVFAPKLERCYVPVLRSLRRLPPDAFTRLVQKDYFEAPEDAKQAPAQAHCPGRRLGVQPDHAPDDQTLVGHRRGDGRGDGIKPKISTGLELVAKLRGMLLGTRQERTRVREFERLLGQLFFDGQEITLVPKEPDAEGFADLVIKVGDEREQKVHDLGDGLQSLIILTFYPFVTEAPTAYFIEEPELFLHPGQQRRLFDFWAQHEQTNHHSFFIATHSNHLLDLSLDFESVSIFRVTKDTSEKAQEGSDPGEIEPHIKVALVGQGDPTTLQQLGVRQSSVFLVNATFWVEGPTDRTYLRRILELWRKKKGKKPFAEDVHYSFVMYGGAAIAHWNFGEADDPAKITAKRLCAQALVIADQDNGKKHQALEGLLGERFVRLRCREIENILPADVIWKVVCHYEKQPPSSAPFAQEAYRDKYLGKFIDDHLGSNRKRRACYAENSGTIKEKVDWANRALEFLTEPTQLTADAEEIAERMYNHIALHNL